MKNRIAAIALCLAVTVRADTPARAQWPLRAPFVVMNTIATLQHYGKRPGFHHGVDLRAAARSKVYAPVSGVVGVGYYYPRYKIPYAYMVSIDADGGWRWELHHVDPASVPPSILELAAKHGRVEAGALVAEIYDTSAAPQLGVPSHLHVELIDRQGVRHDALMRFPPLPSPRAPEIRGVYVVAKEARAVAGVSGQARRESLAPGTYELVVDVLETVSPGTSGDAPFALEVSAAGEVLGALRFERLPYADYLDGVDAVYRLEPFTGLDGKPVANQIESEAPRRFLFRFPLDTAKFRGAREIPVEVRARDRAGDESHAELRLRVE